MSKIRSKVSLLSLSAITLIQAPMQALYGPPIARPTPTSSWPSTAVPMYGMATVQPLYGVISPVYTIMSFLTWIVLPLIILIAIVVGLIVYFRRKKAKTDKEEK
jgi:hypothetical protein